MSLYTIDDGGVRARARRLAGVLSRACTRRQCRPVFLRRHDDPPPQRPSAARSLRIIPGKRALARAFFRSNSGSAHADSHLVRSTVAAVDARRAADALGCAPPLQSIPRDLRFKWDRPACRHCLPALVTNQRNRDLFLPRCNGCARVAGRWSVFARARALRAACRARRGR